MTLDPNHDIEPPDPYAHSPRVYFEAIERAYHDIQRIARDAIAKATETVSAKA
jgi:hypothetical protein